MTTPEKTNPDIAIFPDNNLRITTPAGRVYRGRILHHDDARAPGEKWIQVLGLQANGADKMAQSEAAQFAATALRKGRPSYFPEGSKVEPLNVSFNRIPAAKRTQGNQNTLIGELWDQDGLWTLMISPSAKDAKTLYHGSAVPHKAEIEHNPDSKIAQFQREPKPAAASAGPNGEQARNGAGKRVQPEAKGLKTEPAG